MFRKDSEHLVKSFDFSFERIERLRPVTAADEVRPRVTEYARHVPYEFRGRPHTLHHAKGSKFGRRPAQRLLRAIRKRRKKMIQQFPFTVHSVFFSEDRRNTQRNQISFRIGRSSSFTPSTSSSSK